MTRDRDKTGTVDWDQFWDRAQRQAWEAWSRMAHPTASQPDSQPDDLWKLWSEGLDRLWLVRGAQLAGTSQKVFGRLLDQGKGFLFLSHQLLRAVEKIQTQAEQGQDWTRPLRTAIDSVQDQLRAWSGASAGQAAFWGLPTEVWERLSATLSMMSVDWARQTTETDIPGRGGNDWVRHWPAAGAGREWQLRIQEGGRRVERCQEAWRRYTAKLLDVGLLGLDYLYESLVEAGETGHPIRELRAVYDLWVDAAEQAYAEVAGTPEFAALQAEVINASAAMRIHLNKSLEATARASNLPTRTELDSAHRAIRELRSELRRVRSQLETPAASPTPPRRRSGKPKS